MNYRSHYARLMLRAASRVLTGYTERHHIVPRCMGGADALENIVALTPEEHYVAHQLLVKIYLGNESLLWAAMCMTGKSRKHAVRSNKLYGWLRRRLAERVSSRLKGKPKTTEHRAALAAAKLGKKRGPRSAEHSENLIAAIREAKQRRGREAHCDDPAYKKARSEQMKLIWARRKLGELPLPSTFGRPIRG